MTRHRFRPPARRPYRWWPAAALGLVPHAGLIAALLVGGPWSRVVVSEIYLVAGAVVLTLLLLCLRATRRLAAGLFGATAVGLAAVVGVAVLR